MPEQDKAERRREQMARLVGRTVISVAAGADEIALTFADGAKVRFWHDQECCECVTVDDVSGDWQDLIGTPLLVAEERVSDDATPRSDSEHDSATWTFYTFRTVKGSVDVRWYGGSNGYYSESVDVKVIEAKEERP